MWHRRHHEIFTKSIAPLLIAIAAAIGIGIGICWAATQAATAPKPETKSAEARRAPCAAARGNGHCRRFAAHSRFRDRYRFLDRRRDRRAQIRVRRERREGEAPAPAESTADANGVYEVRIDPDTFDAIVCSAPGYTRQRNPLDTAGHVEIRMDFQLVRGGTVSGHVTDKSTGAPVEGIGIELAGAQENIFERMRGRQNDPGRGARSQQDGSYVLDGVPAGSYRAILSMRGTGYLYKPEDAVPIEIAAGKTYDNIDFTVERGAEITGRVSNAQSGDPIAGASVVAMPAQMIQRTMRRMGSGVTMDLGPNDTRTDEQGEFKLTGLDFDSEYRAIAQADGLASGASEAIQLDRTKAAPHVDIALTRGAPSPAGTVPTGRLPCARIALRKPAKVGTYSWARAARAGDDGAFRSKTCRRRVLVGRRRFSGGLIGRSSRLQSKAAKVGPTGSPISPASKSCRKTPKNADDPVRRFHQGHRTRR